MAERNSTAGLRGSLLRWLPLYLLGAMAVALFIGDWMLPLSEALRTFLLFPLAGLVCALALVWSRRSASLLASEGIDAKVERDPILAGMLSQARPAEFWAEDETVRGTEDRPAPSRAAWRARTPA